MDGLRRVLEDLTGQSPPLVGVIPKRVGGLLAKKSTGIGYSQFNELMLILGYDRVSTAFFQYMVNSRTEYAPGTAIKSVAQLREGVERVRRLSLLFFGNIKFGFKTLSRDADTLRLYVSIVQPRALNTFRSRHTAISPIIEIPEQQTYYLGYMIESNLNARIAANPNDTEAKAELEKRKTLVATGIQNHVNYLASDHLDVYVATSMRERHEYVAVSRFTKELFATKALAKLNLRWFDPTQAFCENRIDKGLAEALMLKRAKCTIYLAQESDTLGKDSELASTLAQGKTVIAYVPQFDEADIDRHLMAVRVSSPETDERSIVLGQLRLCDPLAAWNDPQVGSWIAEPPRMNLKAAKGKLAAKMKAHYDKRAKMLREDHPLGIQVNLDTGVANGVLVVRTIPQCAELVRRVITKTLEFDIEELSEKGGNFCVLREKVSKCIYRLMTRDEMLSNSFWNFYLNPSE